MKCMFPELHACPSEPGMAKQSRRKRGQRNAAKKPTLRGPNRELCRRVRAWGAPMVFITLLRLVLKVRDTMAESQTLDFVEFFSGQQAVTNAMVAASLTAASFELKRDPQGQNMLTPLGFGNAVLLCLSLKPGGGCLMAPVCSSWTFMNRGTSKRCAGMPYGDMSVLGACEGNQMVARCMLLIIILASRGCWWVLEQPRGSLMEEHPAFQRMMALSPIYRHHVRMRQFGGSSEKGA